MGSRIRQLGSLPRPRVHNIIVFSALLMVVIMVVAACSEKVPAPASDDTPPDLSWWVNDGTGLRQDLPSDELVQVEVTGNAGVVLVASDSEGVHKIRMGASEIKSHCVRGDLGRPQYQRLALPEERVDRPDSDGMVQTTMYESADVELDIDCGDGWTLTSATAWLSGDAENYFGGQAHSMLVLRFQP